MFVLPRKLEFGDRVTITGILKSNPNKISINLMTGNTTPDYQNIAYQFEARFPNGMINEDKIIMRVIQNGYEEVLKGDYEEIVATELFSDTNFTFEITIRMASSNYGDLPILNIYVAGTFVHQFQLRHNLSDIRFLMLNGDIEKVDKLDFQFG